MLLKNLGLPENTTSAMQNTRLNGRVLDAKTQGQIVGGGRWELGIDLRKDKNDNTFVLKTWTVAHEVHTVNFYGTLTPDAKVIGGQINCFALGWLPLDQDYLDELLDEYAQDNPKWDKIVEE